MNFCFFSAAEAGVYVGYCKAWLIVYGALTEIGNCHFCHFVNFETVTANQVLNGSSKEIIQLLKQGFLTAVELTKTFNVMLDSKAGLPGSSFGIVQTPGNMFRSKPALLE